MFNCSVLNATLSPKSSMATSGRTRSPRGHRTLPTRLPMVSMSRASKSLVGSWANSCRVRGRLSLLMMARPKSSNACSIGSISREQEGHGTSSHIWANVVVLQPNVVSISSSLVWKAEVFQNQRRRSWGAGCSRPPWKYWGGGGANISFCPPPPIILTTWQINNM